MKILMVMNATNIKMGGGIIQMILNYFDILKNNKNLQFDFAMNLAPGCGFFDYARKWRSNCYQLPNKKENLFKLIKYFLTLTKIIGKSNYDIVHIHGNSRTMAIELLAAFLGGCKVRIAHGHNTTGSYLKAHARLRLLFDLLCTERFACSIEAGKFLFGKRSFRIIPNGIDVREYQFCEDTRKQVREEWGLGDAFIIGHVGSINVQKNHNFLIDVLVELKKYSQKSVLMCIGDGNTAELVLQCERQGVTDSVYFLGKRNDVPRLLQGFDLGLLPSLFEGFPLVAVEWQAAGLPCYISDTVTKEVAFSDRICFLPLGIGAAIWAEKIWNERKAFALEERGRGIDTVKDAGYDIRDNVEFLDKLFHSLVGRKKD